MSVHNVNVIMDHVTSSEVLHTLFTVILESEHGFKTWVLPPGVVHCLRALVDRRSEAEVLVCGSVGYFIPARACASVFSRLL